MEGLAALKVHRPSLILLDLAMPKQDGFQYLVFRNFARAAFVFHWPLIERQVRGEGRVETLSHRESSRYFHRRPRESPRRV